MTLRDRFEIWAAETFYRPNSPDFMMRDGSSYRDARVYGAWIAWQYWATAPG